MVWVAQGTVRVMQSNSQEPTVAINPICDYQVCHKGASYTVFVSGDGKPLMLPVGTSFELDESVKTMLVQAAFSQARILLEVAVEKVKNKPPRYRVVGLQVPAPISK